MKRLLFFLFLALALPTLCAAQTAAQYGLARGNNPAALYFAKLQPATGIVTAVSSQALPDTMYSLNAFSAIDPVNQRYYYMGPQNKLRAVDMATGTVANTYTLNLPTGHYFEMMQYNCADSTLYAMYRTNSPQEMKLCKFDPATNTITIISQNSIAAAFAVNAYTTLDPVNGIYYLYSNTLTGISLATGNIVSAPTLTFPPNAQYIDMLASTCTNGNIFCIARNPSPPLLYMASVDPVTGNVNLISGTPISSAGALNAGSEYNSLTATFYTRGTNATWLGVSGITGNQVSAPTLSLPFNTLYFDLVGRDNCECDFSNPKGIAEENQTALFSIFPSPLASGEALTIRLTQPSNEKGTLYLINALGQRVAEMAVAANVGEVRFSIGAVPAGYYRVLYQTAETMGSQGVVVY